ncbi:hypothetical protein [Roseivirga thermotolerans]|uniref:hypothetical protein n=1 Tax=Roseivirga thermotolerans TaxID=1758176 RepID=UPI00167830E3|nr:hypothetical protein [Roseivirga thermotolerans]
MNHSTKLWKLGIMKQRFTELQEGLLGRPYDKRLQKKIHQIRKQMIRFIKAHRLDHSSVSSCLSREEKKSLALSRNRDRNQKTVNQ